MNIDILLFLREYFSSQLDRIMKKPNAEEVAERTKLIARSIIKTAEIKSIIDKLKRFSKRKEHELFTNDNKNHTQEKSKSNYEYKNDEQVREALLQQMQEARERGKKARELMKKNEFTK